MTTTGKNRIMIYGPTLVYSPVLHNIDVHPDHGDCCRCHELGRYSTGKVGQSLPPAFSMPPPRSPDRRQTFDSASAVARVCASTTSKCYPIGTFPLKFIAAMGLDLAQFPIAAFFSMNMRAFARSWWGIDARRG
jgi:hypothetical protein